MEDVPAFLVDFSEVNGKVLPLQDLVEKFWIVVLEGELDGTERLALSRLRFNSELV